MQRFLNTLRPFLELVCMSRHLALPVPQVALRRAEGRAALLHLGQAWLLPNGVSLLDGVSAWQRTWWCLSLGSRRHEGHGAMKGMTAART